MIDMAVIIYNPHCILHDSALGGHLGPLHTYCRIAQLFYWPNIRTIQTYVAACVTCQKKKMKP